MRDVDGSNASRRRVARRKNRAFGAAIAQFLVEVGSENRMKKVVLIHLKRKRKENENACNENVHNIGKMNLRN